MELSCNSGFYSARLDKPRYKMTETVDYLADLGFTVLDINFCAITYTDPIGRLSHEPVLDQPGELENVVVRCKERGMKIRTSHLPYFNYVKLKGTEELAYKVEMSKKAIDAAAKCGVTWAVVHASPNAQDTVEFLRPLGAYATERGVGLAIENTTKTEIPALVAAVDALRAEGYKAGCCYDTGHGNCIGSGQRDALLQIGGDRLKMLHVHDNFGDRDAHAAPFAGNINWAEFAEALAEIGYTGDLNYEVDGSKIPECARKAYGAYLAAVGNYLIALFNEAKEKATANKS